MRAYILAGLLLAGATAGAAQDHGAATGVQAAPTGEVSAEGDLALIRHFLELDRSYSTAGRAAAVERLDWLDAHRAELTPAGLALEAARIAALADNGHTLSVTGPAGASSGRLAHRTLMMGGRLYMLVSPDPDLIGAEVTMVGARPVAEVRTLYHRTYQGGNEAHRDEGFPAFVETPAALHAAGLIPAADHVVLTLRTADGEVIERSLAPVQGGHPINALRMAGMSATAPNGEAPPLYMRDPRVFFSTTPLPDLDALYVKMQAVVDGGGQPIRPFLTATEAQIDALHPTNLILDLRFNTGGDLNNARDFARGLVGRLPANGRVFAITSGATFSAAISTLGYLKEAGGDRVVIVGEPVGDRLEFWAEGRVVRLPWSGAALLYANERHNYQTGCPEDDCHGSIRRNPIRVPNLDPDLSAPMTIEAFMTGRDPSMEAIAAYLSAGG